MKRHLDRLHSALIVIDSINIRRKWPPIRDMFRFTWRFLSDEDIVCVCSYVCGARPAGLEFCSEALLFHQHEFYHWRPFAGIEDETLNALCKGSLGLHRAFMVSGESFQPPPSFQFVIDGQVSAKKTYLESGNDHKI